MKSMKQPVEIYVKDFSMDANVGSYVQLIVNGTPFEITQHGYIGKTFIVEDGKVQMKQTQSK